MPRTRHRPSPALVVAMLALFIALGGTTYALTIPRNSVGEPQLKDRAVSGRKVALETLTGGHIRERTLGRVRRAFSANRLAGVSLGSVAVGRSGANALCQLQENALNCVTATLSLPHRGRVMVVAASDWYNGREDGGGSWGTCYVQIDGDTTLAGSETTPGEVAKNTDAQRRGSLATTGVTDVLGRGEHAFALRCLEGNGVMVLSDQKISAVLLGNQ